MSKMFKEKKEEIISKVTIKTMGELDKNNRKCEITIFYKNSKGKPEIRDEKTDIKELVQSKYFNYLKPEDKFDVYLKCFHPSSSATSSSSSSSSSSSHRRNTKPKIQIFDKDLKEVKKLMEDCKASILKDVRYVEIHHTLLNDNKKLRVKITIHYNEGIDPIKDKKHIRKNHLLELYNDCIKTEQRHLVDKEPTGTNNNNIDSRYIPRRSSDENTNRTNLNNINGLERKTPVSSKETDEPSDDEQCRCVVM